MTKREFEIFQVPVGETLLGQVCNFVGQSTSSQVCLSFPQEQQLLSESTWLIGQEYQYRG